MDRSRQISWDHFLSMPLPRRIPEELAHAALKIPEARSSYLLGCIFFLVGLFFCWGFAPVQLVKQWQLQQGESMAAPGLVNRVVETNAKSNGRRIFQYHYQFQPGDGQIHFGSAYTTGKRWSEGDSLDVRYLANDRSISLPQGDRLDKFSVSASLVFIFPIVGFFLIFTPLQQKRFRKYLLQHGKLATATVTSVKTSRWSRLNQHRHTIELVRMEDGMKIVRRTYDLSEASFVYMMLELKEKTMILQDPRRPSWLIFPEMWRDEVSLAIHHPTA
jgi:hypothetical protein